MSVVSNTIPNLVSGVSQQPFAMRLASQAEAQVNAMSSVVEGLRKRPPSHHIAKLMDLISTGAHVHVINRDGDEQYIVILQVASLRVFRLDGTEVPVNFDGLSGGYLTVADAVNDFAAVTVADYTFIVNKSRTVDFVPEPDAVRRPEALVWVRQGNYSCNYSVNVSVTDNVSATVTTPDASQPANQYQIQTDAIAQGLSGQLNSVLSGTDISSFQLGSTLWLHRSNTNDDFNVSVSDSLGDTALKLVKNTVQRFSDLPARAVDGFVCGIQSAETAGTTGAYYVRYAATPGNSLAGVWKETLKPGEAYRLDTGSMPHILVREENGTFTFKEAAWDPRDVGDLETIPMPSFVGRKITDVFFYRNRLGLLAGENVVMSRNGEFFNFFRASAIQTLDTDPIDVAVSHTKVSMLRHAVPFNETLMLFSDETQFMLGKTDILTPKTIAINQATEFDCSNVARPVGVGKNVYFAVNRGKFTSIREFYVDSDTQSTQATDTAAHVPSYIPDNVVSLAASPNEDMLVALSASKPGSLFVYRFFWQGNTKVQSSWSEWTFCPNTKVLAVAFHENELLMVTSRVDGTYLEKIFIEPARVDDGATWEVHLDRRAEPVLTYVPVGDYTEVKLPYSLTSDVDAGAAYRLVAGHVSGPVYKDGAVVPFTVLREEAGKSVLKASGQLTAAFVGRSYTMRYRFSPLLIREQAPNGGSTVVGEGRVQVRKMNLTFNMTGYFRVEVTPSRRDTYRYVYAGRTVGAGAAIGDVAIDQGTFPFPVASKNDQVTIEIVSDSHLPCAFLSAEWEAFFSIRSKRM